MIFAGRELKIEYINPYQKDYGAYYVKQILVDEIPYAFKAGEPVIERKVIELLENTNKHTITVILE